MGKDYPTQARYGYPNLRAHNMIKLTRFLAISIPLLFAIPFFYAQSGNNHDKNDERIARWQTYRFGMFIHWGPVSLRGTEIGWSRGAGVPIEEYDTLYKRFNPTEFNADQWVSIAKAAGMKYIVLTSKHHDGFCLWDTKFTDYNIMNTPFKRDIVKELAAACKRHGIAFGLYYSIADWHHPDYPLGSPGGKTEKPYPNMDRYNEYVKSQLRELTRDYGPLLTFWFDGEWEQPWTYERGADLYKFVRDLQPDILVNNRVGKAREGIAGTSSQTDKNPGDYDTPEQQVGRFTKDRPWESCITICEQWAWKPNDDMKSLKRCLQTLIQCASGDGNLLLNVGPMPTGEIEPRQVARLKEMGAWLSKYGSTIYGTHGGPFKPGKWGASTYRDNKIYLHVFAMPGSGLELPGIQKKIVSIKNLTGGTVKLTQTKDRNIISVSHKNLQPISTIIELTLDGNADEINPVDISNRVRAERDGSLRCTAVEAEIIGSTARVQSVCEDIPDIGYWTDMSDSARWVVSVSKAGMYDVIAIVSCDSNSAGSKFSLRLDQQELFADVPTTKGWCDYTTVNVGRVTLNKTGDETITIVPTAKPGVAVMNLREVVLKPLNR